MKKNYFTHLYAWKTTSSPLGDFYPIVYTDAESPGLVLYNSNGDIILENGKEPYYAKIEPSTPTSFYIESTLSTPPPFYNATYYRDDVHDIDNEFITGTYTYSSKHIDFDSEFISIPDITLTWFNPNDEVLPSIVTPTNITTSGFDIPSFSNTVSSVSNIYYNFTYTASGMNLNSFEAYDIYYAKVYNISDDNNKKALLCYGYSTDFSFPTLGTHSTTNITVNISPDNAHLEFGRES